VCEFLLFLKLPVALFFSPFLTVLLWAADSFFLQVISVNGVSVRVHMQFRRSRVLTNIHFFILGSVVAPLFLLVLLLAGLNPSRNLRCISLSFSRKF